VRIGRKLKEDRRPSPSPNVVRHKMRVFTFIILVLSLQINAQESSTIKKLLDQNSYPSVRSYIDSISRITPSSISIEDDDTKVLFDEVVARNIHFSQLIPYNGIGNVNNYRLNVLANGNQIVYYRLTSNIYQEHKGKLFPASIVDSFRNESSYNKIFDDYEKIYEVPLTKDELWSNDIVYGWSCGIAGGMPEEAKKTTRFVKLKQLDSIRNWLRSPNAVKQLYAIKAFSMLGDKFLSPRDKEIIKLISQKNVSIPVCGGCIYSRQEVSEILNVINSKKATKFSYGWILAITLLILASIVLYFRRRTT